MDLYQAGSVAVLLTRTDTAAVFSGSKSGFSGLRVGAGGGSSGRADRRNPMSYRALKG